MQIVIKLADSVYKELQANSTKIQADGYVLENAILNGTPLPKEYGRLMILSEDKLKENQINLDFSCQKWISEVGLSNATLKIIEADKAESEE